MMTSSIKILTKRLNDVGISTKYIKNPNGSAFGKLITEAIIKEKPLELAEIYAFTACLCQTVNHLIQPALDQGYCVISDRGKLTAYSHALHRHRNIVDDTLFEKIIESIGNGNAINPDLTIFLNLPHEESFSRKKSCRDSSELDIMDKGGILEAKGANLLSDKTKNLIKVTTNEDVSKEKASDIIWNNVKSLLNANNLL